MLRAEHIDILRIIACLMVIFNHTNERGFLRYVTDVPGTPAAVWNLLFSIACKSAVPIFFMISGSMLIRKEEPALATYRRIPRIIADYLIFSLVYYGCDAYLAGSPFSLKETLIKLITGPYWHLWYLCSYVALLITMPFLRDFARNLKLKNAVLLYGLAVFLMGIMPVIEYFAMPVSSSWKPSWMFADISIYPLLGYFIDNRVDVRRIPGKYMLALWMADALAFLVSERAEYCYLCREPGSYSEVFLCTGCIINAVTIFATAKWLFSEKIYSRGMHLFLAETGKCTFGIYLIHILILWKIKPFYSFWSAIEQISTFGKQYGIFISCIMVFIVAGMITYMLRKVPVIKKLL